MSVLAEWLHNWRSSLAKDFTPTILKTAIVVWALFVICIVIFIVDDPWLLAGIFLYEVLP